MTLASLQVEFGEGLRMAAGGRLLIAGPGYTGDAEPDVRTTTSLANAVSGVALVSDDRRRVDGVTLSEHADTACQSGDDKLGSALDYRAGESWQRTSGGAFAVAERTPGHGNSSTAYAAVTASANLTPAAVLISEFATDPVITPAPAGVERSNFVELGNFSNTTQDVGGWRLYACGRNGFLSHDPLASIPPGTLLRPGGTWLAALEGTEAAASADSMFATAFDFQGAGVWIEDADGQRVDGVGAFHVNEMDRSIDTASPCTSGLTLPVFAVDRLRGETYQRATQTGDNMDDFTAAPATPGMFDQPPTEPLESRALAVAERLYDEPRLVVPQPPSSVVNSRGFGCADPGGLRRAFAGGRAGNSHG